MGPLADCLVVYNMVQVQVLILDSPFYHPMIDDSLFAGSYPTATKFLKYLLQWGSLVENLQLLFWIQRILKVRHARFCQFCSVYGSTSNDCQPHIHHEGYGRCFNWHIGRKFGSNQIGYGGDKIAISDQWYQNTGELDITDTGTIFIQIITSPFDPLKI